MAGASSSKRSDELRELNMPEVIQRRGMNRRGFIQTSAAFSLGLLLSNTAKVFARTPKKVLVFGGTDFLGPAVVDALMADGHTVTIFNRGVTNAELFSHVEKLRGFRSSDSNDQDLSALSHRRFDVVIDVWPNDPDVVASAAEFMKDRTNHYLFVSSVGAYDHKFFAKPEQITEDTPLQPWDARGRPYNRNKAESERRLHKIIGERLTIVRPGPIKGRGDNGADLLTWLLRAQDGGDHIGPGDGKSPVELVDAKDVARFLTLAIDRGLYGVFNTTGRSISFQEFLNQCKAATRSDVTFVWIPQEFLHQHGLESDAVLHTFVGNFPLWLPDPQDQGLYRVSSAKAYAAGWQTRPFEETAFDCLSDFYSGQSQRPNYLTAAREKEVLEAWKKRTSLNRAHEPAYA
jgi:2'-hydroxyisoflavone reductase